MAKNREAINPRNVARRLWRKPAFDFASIVSELRKDTGCGKVSDRDSGGSAAETIRSGA